MKMIRELSALIAISITIAGCASTPPVEKEIPAAPSPAVQATPASEAGPAATEAAKTQAAASYGKVSPFFTENHGQLNPAVRFYVKGSRGTVYFTPTEVVYDFLRERETPEAEKTEVEEPPRGPDRDAEKKREYDRLVFRAKFSGAGPAGNIAGRKELPGKVNYFIGDQSKWRPNIPTFEEISYQDLYPGIEVLYRFEGNNPRSRITVKPGADPKAIRYVYEGVDGLDIDPEGNLSITTAFGAFGEKAPKAYQEIDGKRTEVPITFTLSAPEKMVGFEIGAYDTARPLVIE